ncbi:MAG: UDP-N-acetylmuramoyl-L-alanyl-D-glutamate--2,6-diaminopimelate ligase [Deltaproteobacteria bacterium]|jgi:UDP-N-acetylmuramoyl-L-alanyl-D-glutamate--2,6-diaminopimelate ligase|nr:UDP-N-acetylmuramoyl-L-alanyl-D-glutamate--2,6-diaminopimelate ligase [Deltaproteobacteria bacterium]
MNVDGLSLATLDSLAERLRNRSLPALRVHSGQVRAGDVFVALPPNRPGEKGGLDFLEQVLAAGAGALVCAEAEADRAKSRIAAARKNIELCPVPDVRAALGALAGAWHGTEHYRPTLVGVTGTNGKTTGAYLLECLFQAAGRKVGVLGTISYRWPGFSQEAPLTTPTCLDLHALLAQMQAAGTDTVIMEVSSHALAQNRVAGLHFTAASFSNLTQDHLDYHKDMEDYYQCKARLFRPPFEAPERDKARAININSSYGLRLMRESLSCPGRNIAYGIVNKGDAAAVELFGNLEPQQKLEAELAGISPQGIHLRHKFAGQEWEIRSPLAGVFNAANLLGAQATALGLGLEPRDLTVLETFSGVPGRLERITGADGKPARLDVFVDYAHTPDALVNAITGLRDAGFKRVIALFGCGGDRDRTKRPKMGAAVCKYADVAVLTSDNPRTEDPRAIMDDVVPGMQGCPETYREVDRKKATELAISLMKPGDALLVAGKGHENYQILGKEKIHYSDQEVVREILGVKP